ncbi:MAG: hypothetical protein NTW86_27860 [Candidatus Sumerlaeota bacterium]|nr:hypothetical protein [Candidatus Sumerlaeota bacterium]
MATRQPDPVQTYIQLVHGAGWDPTALKPRRKVELRLDAEAEPVPGRLLSLHHEGAPVAALFVLEGVRFPSGETLYQRYLDMTSEGRLCLRAAAALAPAPYVFVASPYECMLYDAATEELLQCATSPEESAARIFSRFTPEAYANGALDGIPRRTPRQWGKDLWDWLRVWHVKIGRASRTPSDILTGLLQHWLLAWKDALTPGRARASDSLGIVVEAADDPCAVNAAPLDPAQFHAQHVAAVSERFPMGIFKAMEARERSLWRDEVAASTLTTFLAEARLLSRSKFRVANALYALTDEKTESKSWKAALTQEARIARLLLREDLTIHDAVAADIRQNGYGWALTLFEDLVRYWIEENLKRKELAEERGPLGVQLDLFAPPPAGLHPMGYLQDVLLFALTHAFRLRTRDADERLLAGLLLAMKTLELSEDYSLPLGRFEKFDRVFES